MKIIDKIGKEYFGSLILMVALAGFPFSALAYCDYGWGSGYGSGSMMRGGWFSGWLGILTPFIYFVLIIVAVGMAAKIFKAKSKNTNEALEILRQRYAKGELGDEEFKQMKKELEL